MSFPLSLSGPLCLYYVFRIPSPCNTRTIINDIGPEQYKWENAEPGMQVQFNSRFSDFSFTLILYFVDSLLCARCSSLYTTPYC